MFFNASDTLAKNKSYSSPRVKAALRRSVVRWPVHASSALLRIETVRALRRSGNDQLVGWARRLLRTLHLVSIDEPMLDQAGDLAFAGLSSLDAVHLATALALGTEMGVLFTYDGRLREAAESCGLTVAAPE